MRQRVIFASVCLGNPQVMILDEPTAGLDPEELIKSVADKIFEIKCSGEIGLKQLTKIYKKGNVHQGRDGVFFRIVGEMSGKFYFI